MRRHSWLAVGAAIGVWFSASLSPSASTSSGGENVTAQDPVVEAKVTTDRRDYSPGDTVRVTGSGWLANESVRLSFEAQLDPAPAPRVFTAIADAAGNFTDQSFVAAPADYGVSYRLYATGLTSGRAWVATFVDEIGGDLDQCANGPLASPVPCIDLDSPGGPNNPWENGALNANKAHYLEGDSIPYRLRISGLDAGTHTVTIEWDTTKSGKHAIDYLTTFNRTETTAVPCDVEADCSTPTTVSTFAIPVDPNLGAVIPVAGDFTLYNGTITGVSAYTLSGTFAADSSTRITITFTTPASPTRDPVLAWGGHIASRADWGQTGSAVSIPGSPYHTRLIAIDGKGGNQDRALSTEAVIFPASITIIKQTDPASDPQDFAFTTTGGLSPATFTLDTDAGSSPPDASQLYANLLVLDKNGVDITVAETPVAKWALSFPSPACTVTSANGGSTGLIANGVSINLREGENVTCTFINTKQRASLTLVKHVVNDNGGSAAATAWNLQASGTQLYSGPGSESGQTFEVDPDTYTLSETGGPSGYTASAWVCTGDGTQNGSQITLANGQSATCTITNDDQAASLTVIKHVINDNGGTKVAADFTMAVTGTNVQPSSSFPGAEAPGTTVTLDAGSYSVDENAVSGYTKSIGANCSGTIANGESKTCTVTNDDQAASLTVIKHVINDNGGTKVAADFTMAVTGTNVQPSSSFPGAEAPGTTVTLDAGSYSVDENAVSGYTKSIGANCSGTIANGESKTCTITNDDDAPSLTLSKVVVNDNGGTAVAGDFTLTASGPTGFSGAGPSVSNGASFDAGIYTLSETTVAGYTASAWVCTGGSQAGDKITLALGESATCTITNDDDAPSLTLNKVVVNDNGGTAQASAFTLAAAGPTGFSGAGPSVSNGASFDAGTYTLSETNVTGYTASAWTCVGGSQAGNQISVGLGQSATCTITNNDDAPGLTLVKVVDNTFCGAGCATTASFTLSANGPTGFSGSGPSISNGAGFSAGTYNLSESAVAGYAASAWACVGTGTQNDVDTITLGLGQSATCTITNTAIPARLRVIKSLNPTDDTGLFNLLIDGNAYASDVGHNGTTGFQPVVAGVPHVVSETAGTGTVLTDYVSAINGACAANGQITLGLNQEATCTITNTKKGMVTLHKLTNGVDNASMTWNFTLAGPGGVNVGDSSPPTTVEFGGVKLLTGSTNIYTICETGIPAGWTLEWKVDTDSDGTPDTIIPFFAGANTPPAGWTGYSNVYDPSYVAPPAQYTNDTRCVQFTVQPGQTLAFEINNTFPGGEPRTIGYWKNWNTCTGGNQAETAAKNGGPAAGWYILDNLLNNPGYHLGPAGLAGLTLDGNPTNALTGNIVGPDCVAAVRLLDKSSINDGKKKASDAAYNMAAQLLAALLNLSAGAETCSAVTTAAGSAQSLLVTIGFNGTGSYLTKSNTANYKTAIGLGAILDQYNNGNLCTP